MQNYNEKVNNFKERVNAASVKLPIQEVRKVETKSNDEVQLNIWLPKKMLTAIKQKALDEDKSIKEVVQEAISKHLSSV